MSEVKPRIERLRAAFSADGFDVPEEQVVLYRGRIGMRAVHRTAADYESGAPKTAFYVEGSPFEMGYLLGRLAEPEIARMTELFIDRVFRAMIREAMSGERMDYTGTKGPKVVSMHGLLIALVRDMIRARHVLADVPVRFHQEIRGIVAGCKEAARPEHRTTAVTEGELWVLNAGLDCVLSRMYTGVMLPAPLRPKDLWLPIACNGFAILNGAAAEGPLFGRDFMFPTGGIFHEVVAHIIYRPDLDRREGPACPFVALTAPGIVGAVAGMNDAGVAGGVNMTVGGNCDPSRPGFNSLLLLRDAIERATHIEGAVQRMLDARRGVTWSYLLSGAGEGGRPDRACVVEAGASMEDVPFLEYPSERIRPLLPDEAFLEAHRSAELVRGAMVRWDGYRVPEEYLEFNAGLCDRFHRSVRPAAFGSRGRINRTPSDRNCPGGYYFAPPRGRPREVLLATNHFVIPEMRLCSMAPWANRMFRARLNDSQWRYDELNHRILSQLERDGPIGFDGARGLLSFLSPDGEFPDYYRLNPTSSDGRERLIFGSLSLFDLKRRTVESRYGWYPDPWVRIQLPNYLVDE